MYCIGITGGSAGGKTTFVNLLKNKFSKDQVTFISLDDYYKANTHLSMSERAKINYDHPNAIDFGLLNQHITDLKNGIAVSKPTYDFTKHNRTSKTKTILPKKVLILEGILILNDPKILSALDYTIFIDASAQIRLERRITRDIKDRGRTKNSVLKQWETTINPMHNQFVEPYKNIVDLIINGTQPFNKTMENVSKIIKKHL